MLLNMLNIPPFSFELIIQQVFDDGSIYNPEVFDITEQTLHSCFLEGVRNLASVCRLVTELLFQCHTLASMAAATTAAPATAAAPAKAEAKEKLEESDEDMGFVLFD
ncbi:60S acidic ribosomal protein P0 [Microtus ochrogaster]|uniref:Large ribosomal subunit protein uL10 n=1 Tax=Microtus ochrogaster TaxID=79684 RepID=A0A8J6H2I2_MICOH|nr:60S acidic ribosomal protein P0 [Microtus ochrogaster]